MGCHQSKVEEQVQAPVSDAAAPEAAAPVDAAPAVEAAPVSTAPATEEVTPASEAPAAAPAAEVEAEVSAVVEEAPASSTVSDVTSTEAIASETQQEVVEVTEAAAPAAEPVAEEPVATEAAGEPEVETAPAVAEEDMAESSVSFVSAGTTVEQNVVFYQFTLVDKEDPAKETLIRKRFNDFKTLHAQVAKLMANESNVPASQGAKFETYPALPALPKAGVSTVLLGRKNKNLTAEREAQFAKILNAIARHPIAYQSEAVKAFVA